MCNPISLLAAGATMEFSGKLQQGRAAQRQANEDAARMEYQAAIEQDNAIATAEQIRRQGVRDRGQTVAAIGASGVKIGDGSALDAERQVMTDAETDAYLAILNGDRNARGLREDAANRRRAGRDAKRAASLAAVGTLLSRGAQGYELYKSRLAGLDLMGPSGTNDRSSFSFGSNPDWWVRNGRSGD